jgi:hypothetical protein
MPPKPSCRHKAAPINGLSVTVRETVPAGCDMAALDRDMTAPATPCG